MAKKGLHINVYRVPGGIWRCDLKLNTSEAGEGLTIRGTSEDDDEPGMRGAGVWNKIKGGLSKAGIALAKAKTIAKAILSNPALAQAFPAYVIPSMLALDAIEKAEKHGKLSAAAKQLTDPTLKKLAREMNEMSQGKRTAMSGGGICLACDRPPQRSMRGNTGIMPGMPTSAPSGDNAGQPFGIPPGTPHPFTQMIKQQLVRGQFRDPITLQKLARMQAYQRGMAKASR